MDETRGSTRKRTFLAAYAKFGEGRLPVACMVRDLTQSGARILLGGSEDVPRTFDLHINGRDKVWRVEIVWRRAAEIGVRVLSKRPYQVPGAPYALANPRAGKAAVFHVDAVDVCG